MKWKIEESEKAGSYWESNQDTSVLVWRINICVYSKSVIPRFLKIALNNNAVYVYGSCSLNFIEAKLIEHRQRNWRGVSASTKSYLHQVRHFWQVLQAFVIIRSMKRQCYLVSYILLKAHTWIMTSCYWCILDLNRENLSEVRENKRNKSPVNEADTRIQSMPQVVSTGWVYPTSGRFWSKNSPRSDFRASS